MQRMIRCMPLACFTLMLISLISCRKLADLLHKDPLMVKKGCNITKLIHDDEQLGVIRTHLFSYNAQGNPVSVINDNAYEGAPQLYFRYNDQHQLSDYIALDEENSSLCVFWYRYVYNAAQRVIRDTQWVFGTFADEPDYNSMFIHVRTYSYDAYGRISSKTRTQIHPVVEAPVVTTYTYDASGNLIVSGAVYDNRLNFRRTNKVWMFIDANYSLNNSPGAVSYSVNDLPLQFNTATDFVFIGLGGLGTSTFEYECP